MRVKLVLLGDHGERTVYRLKKLPTVIGRGRDADLTLAHPLASRHHCELYEVDGTLCVRDMGSLNGTFVGDFRVTEAALESGDILVIGGGKFEVLVEKDAEPLLPPTAPQESAATAPARAETIEPATIEPEILEPEVADAEPADDVEELDFAEVEPVEITPTVPVKPEAKPSPPAKPQSPQPKAEQPKAKPTTPPKDAAAPAESKIDFSGLGQEPSDAVSTDDSGLNSFLKKL